MRSHQLDDKRDCFSGILRHEAPAGRQNERCYFSAWKEDNFLVEVVCRRVHVCGHVQSCSCTIVSCKLTEHAWHIARVLEADRLDVLRNMFCTEVH